ASPLGSSHPASRALTCSASCLEWQHTTRSSAYLVSAGLPALNSLAWEPVRYRTPAAFSSPCNAIFNSKGEITPPCGVPLDHRRSKQSGLTGDTDLTSESDIVGDDLPGVKNYS